MEPKEKQNANHVAADIMAIAKKYHLEKEAADFIVEGKSAEEFNRFALDKLASTKNEETIVYPDQRGNGALPSLGLTRKELQGYSLLRAVEDLAAGKFYNNGGLVREVDLALAKQMGPARHPNSIRVPFEAFALPFAQRALAVSGTGSNLVATDVLAGDFIDVLRNTTRVIEAGARTITGLVGDAEIPRKTSGATAGWVGEGSDVGESTAALDQVSLAFKTVGCFTDITRKMRLQSSRDAETLVRDDLTAGIAQGLDAGAISGTGATNQPTGLANTTGINTGTFGSTGAPTWAEVVNLETLVDTDNALLGSLAYMGNAAMTGHLKTTDKGTDTGKFLLENGQLNGYKYFGTNQSPANSLIFANWSDLIIGIWGPAVEIVVDNASLSKSGGLRLVAFLSCDVAVRHPVSFAVGS